MNEQATSLEFSGDGAPPEDTGGAVAPLAAKETDLGHQSSSARQSAVVALIVAGAFFMENLGGTVVATALPQMARSFSSTPLTVSLGISAYLLTLGRKLIKGIPFSSGNYPLPLATGRDL